MPKSISAPERLSAATVAAFQEKVYAYYQEHGRSFPWREPDDPYHILVSEVMLQQTQAGRVVAYYRRFIDAYPTISDLAAAPVKEVLARWQGLGYNRRALLLHRTANYVCEELDGNLPLTEVELVKLPGIGPYTAAAIAAFAGNRPAIVIETNIRSVFIHQFFGDQERIPDKRLLPLIEQTVDTENPREWYQALMDYGAMLKKSGVNPSRRSRHYVRQSVFRGSNRELRGQVLKLVVDQDQTVARLARQVGSESARINQVTKQLIDEGFIRENGARFRIAE